MTKLKYLNLDQIIISINLSTQVFFFPTKTHKFHKFTQISE